MDSAERRAHLSQLRYRAGLEGRLEQLDSQRQLYAAQQTLLDLQREAFGSTVTATEAARSDQIKVLFANNGESLLQRSASHTEIRGNDVAMVFDNPGVNGEIVFQNIGSYINLDSFEFRVDLGFMDFPLAV